MIFKANKEKIANTNALLKKSNTDFDNQACVNVNKVITCFTRTGNHLIKNKREIIKKPWFLLCNLSQIKSTSFIYEALGKPLITFPSDPNKENKFSGDITWYCYDKSIWIETAEKISNEENNLQAWSALSKSLGKVKKRNTLSGFLLAVDIAFFMNEGQANVSKTFQELKCTINELQRNIKSQIPVYLIFLNCELITGFSTFFDDYPGKDADAIIGLTINNTNNSDIGNLFSKEIKALNKNIENGVLERIGIEHDDSKKRDLCLFLVTFNEIQQKIALLISDLIEQTLLKKQIILSGLYFTSNLKNHSDSNPIIKNNYDQITISTKICLTSAIFNKIINAEVLRSRKINTKFYHTRTFVTLLTVTLLAISIVLVIIYKLASGTLEYVNAEINKIPESDMVLTEQYYAINRMQEMLKKIENNPFLNLIDKKRNVKIQSTIRMNYYKRVKRFVMMPAVKYLEYQLAAATDNRYTVVGEKYEHVYKILRCYLLLSEAAPREYKLSDLLQLHPLILEAIRQSIFTTISSSVLAENVETILSNTIKIYLKELHKDRSLRIQENQKLISIVRTRMRGVLNVKEVYHEKVNKYSNQFSLIALEDILNRDKDGILKTNKAISSFYSQEGWEKFIKIIVPDVINDTCAHDWVVGDENGLKKNKSNDSLKIKDALIEIYFKTCKEEWLSFLNSVYMNPFSNIDDASKALIKLTGENGEIQLLLGKITQYTLIKNKDIENAENLLLNEKYLLKVKKTVQEKGLKKFIPTESSVYLKEYNDYFDKLRTFVSTNKEGKCSYLNYKENVSEVIENLLSIKQNEYTPLLQQFDGKETDLLMKGFKNTQRELLSLPEELSKALQKIVLDPYRYTASPISKLIIKRLNAKWQNEIVNYFSRKLSSKYPFDENSNIDAAYSDVMDFFRPVTGIYWGFFDRELAMVYKKEKNGWIKINQGLIELSFNPAFDSSLKYSARISTMLFNSDGSLRSYEMKISSNNSSQNNAQIEAFGQKIVLKSGSSPCVLKWPGTISQKAALSVLLNDSFSTGISYNGPWSFFKLLQVSKINYLDENTFVAKWKVNIQNMYSVYISSRFQISGGDNPFSEKIFEKVTIPSVLLINLKNANEI